MRVLNSLKDNFVSRCCIKVLIVVEKEHVALLTATASWGLHWLLAFKPFSSSPQNVLNFWCFRQNAPAKYSYFMISSGHQWTKRCAGRVLKSGVVPRSKGQNTDTPCVRSGFSASCHYSLNWLALGTSGAYLKFLADVTALENLGNMKSPCCILSLLANHKFCSIFRLGFKDLLRP